MAVLRRREEEMTPTPPSKCAKAVDKGVRRILYGNAEKKEVSGEWRVTNGGKEAKESTEVRKGKDLG
jgi:hypothetical protein